MLKLLLFMLLNSVDKLYAYYYWMWISPLLFECCLYVDNVQITRISCWCELTSSRVVLGLLWYVTGWRSCIVSFLLRGFMIYVDGPFEMDCSISCLWCWGLLGVKRSIPFLIMMGGACPSNQWVNFYVYYVGKVKGLKLWYDKYWCTLGI
jgi:hypothetical protein